MLLLAFDTATPRVTVALHDGSRLLASYAAVDAHRHAELLAPAIAKVIADAGVSRADLTAVAAGVGPGPYTGLRVGIVTARVLADSLGIPGHGVCTLDAIAAGCQAGGEFLVATDARRREVYWARYGQDGRRLTGPEVTKPADVPRRSDVPAAGQGAELYPDLLGSGQSGQMPLYPDAAEICSIVAAAPGNRYELLPLEPLYLRRPDAREPGAPKRVSRS